MDRISKENYYLDIAQTVLERATCLRRVYGAIIVKNDEIISTGYNGAPRGRANCVDMGYCTRERLQDPSCCFFIPCLFFISLRNLSPLCFSILYIF